jgi:hypothetical protein
VTAKRDKNMKAIPTPKHTHPPMTAPCFTLVCNSATLSGWQRPGSAQVPAGGGLACSEEAEAGPPVSAAT